MPNQDKTGSSAGRSKIQPGARHAQKSIIWNWRVLLPALILLGLPWVVYSPSLSGPFLFDDLSGIRDNEGVQSLDHVSQMLRFWEPSNVSYRPLRYFSYALDWVRGGGSAQAFHETNLLLHGLAGLLLFQLLGQLLPRRSLAFWIALLWLVHPLQVDAVAYISGRKDLLGTLFYLLALLGVAHRGRAVGAPGRLAWSTLFYAAALLSFLAKEMALTIPLAALLVDMRLLSETGWAWRDRLGSVLRRGLVFYGLMLVAGGSALVYKLVIAPGTKLPFDLLSDPVRNIPLALQTLSFFLRKAIWPWPLVADLRGLFPSALAAGGGWGVFWNGGGAMATLLGLLALPVFWFVARRSQPDLRGQILGGLLVWGVMILPVANLIPLNEPAAEHFAHLPLSALAVVLVSVAVSLGQRWRVPSGRGRVAALLLFTLLAGASFTRSVVWRDNGSLWHSVLAVHQGSDRAWNNLGLVRLEEGDRVGALQAFEQGLEVGARPLPQLVANLVQMHKTDGDLAAALRYGRLGLQNIPDDPLLLALTGGVLLSMGQANEALDLLERVASIPGGAQATSSSWPRDRALAHVLSGDVKRGELLLREAAILQPDDPSILASLGFLFLEQKRVDEALDVLKSAALLPGASGVVFRNLAVAFFYEGRYQEAAGSLKEAEKRGDSVPPSLRQAVNEAISRAIEKPAGPEGEG